jgi:hypothetical protein
MTVERSRIHVVLGGAALVAALSTPAAWAQAPSIAVYRDPT